MPVKGIQSVSLRYKQLTERDIVESNARAVYKIAISIRQVSDSMTPVHISNLINSGFIDREIRNKIATARIGYTAEYAAAVHKKKGTLKGQPRPERNGRPQGNYWDPMGEPKWLEKAVEEVKPMMMRIIMHENKR